MVILFPTPFYKLYKNGLSGSRPITPSYNECLLHFELRSKINDLRMQNKHQTGAYGLIAKFAGVLRRSGKFPYAKEINISIRDIEIQILENST